MLEERLTTRDRPTRNKFIISLKKYVLLITCFLGGGAFDSAKNHKRQRRKRQSVTAKQEKSQTPKFV